MTISRGEIKGEILSFLNKSPNYQGFYDDKKVDTTIQECFDYLASIMMFESDGWMLQIWELDTVSNQVSIDIPPDCAVINRVRYLIGPLYTPMKYVDDEQSSYWSPTTGANQYPSIYKILQNRIFWNPPVSVGAVKGLQIEGSAFPERLKSDRSFAPSRFNRGLLHYIKYRCCSILASQFGKPVKEWQVYENQWYNEIEKLIGKRVNSSSTIKDFDGEGTY